MFRSTLLILTLSIGCRAIPTETCADESIGYNIDDAVASDDTGEEAEIDTAIVEEDSAIEDTGDTDIEETPNCSFELVASGNGRIEVSNELRFSLVPSPSDSVHDDLDEVFRFNSTSIHPECGAVTADRASFNIHASDNDGGDTHWANGNRIEMIDLTVDPATAIMSGITEMNSGGDIYGPHSGVLTVPAGETHQFAVFMDTSGASSDDMLQLELRRYMHILGTPESAAAVMMDDDLVGGAFVY